MQHDGNWLRSSLADATGWDQLSVDAIVDAIEAAGMRERPFVPRCNGTMHALMCRPHCRAG